jgi:hypothetical protein
VQLAHGMVLLKLQLHGNKSHKHGLDQLHMKHHNGLHHQSKSKAMLISIVMSTPRLTTGEHCIKYLFGNKLNDGNNHQAGKVTDGMMVEPVDGHQVHGMVNGMVEPVDGHQVHGMVNGMMVEPVDGHQVDGMVNGMMAEPVDGHLVDGMVDGTRGLQDQNKDGQKQDGQHQQTGNHNGQAGHNQDGNLT